LIFDKYGNRYFLAKLFDEGNPSGSQVLESRYEKKISQASAEGQEHVAHCAEKLGSAGSAQTAGRLLKSSLHNGL